MRRAPIAMLCWLALVSVVYAETGVDEVLRGAQPRQVCTPDDKFLPETPGDYRALPAPELACALQPDAVRAMLGNAQVVVVDTRSAGEFAEFHIDAALNMDWHRVRTSPFYGTHTIVLVGSGKAERSLYVACSDLRRSGNARVHVLSGGMGRWAASGQPLVGRAPDLERYLTLNDEELLEELSFANNLPLALPKASTLRGQEPRIELLMRTEPNALTQALGRRTGTRTLPTASVLLLTGGARHAGWSRYIAASAPLPLLIYEGRPEQFSLFMRQKRAIWAAHDRGPAQLPCSL